MKTKKILRILVPVFMFGVVAGIMVFQNYAGQTSGDALVAADGEYPLNIEKVDMETLSKSGLPIIIDFGADECIPCKEMAPVLATLNAEMQGKAIVQFVDVWKEPEAARGFPVSIIPTQIFINADGTPYIPSEEVANAITFSVSTHNETEQHMFTYHQGGLSEEQMRLILADMGVES